MSTNVFFTDEKQKTKIMTTRKTGGLLYPYKGMVLAVSQNTLKGLPTALFIIGFLLINFLQLNFINSTYYFYSKVIFIIVIAYIINSTIFKKVHFLKVISIILCVLAVSILSIYHYLFGDLLYTTEIQLNDSKIIIVKEHFKLNDYVTEFYIKNNFLLMRKVENGLYLILNTAPFMNGDYKLEYQSNEKVIINYKRNMPDENGNLIEYEDITINL